MRYLRGSYGSLELMADQDVVRWSGPEETTDAAALLVAGVLCLLAVVLVVRADRRRVRRRRAVQEARRLALSGPQDCVRDMLQEYKARRDQVLAWLAEEPRLECAVPQGAFYLFPSVSEFLSPDGHRTSLDFADALLRDEHVVTTAGEAFDTPGFVRISYATSLDRLREGVTRLIRFARQ